MKLLHLADLHLGKRVNEFSLLEDQRAILASILRIAEDERPDAVLIAGDVYDKTVPPAEAVELFDDFLVGLAARSPHVFVISGNHDSPERIAFGSRLMDAGGVHMAPVYSGVVRPVTLRDEWGSVNVYMLPFLKPAHVRRFYPEAGIESYTDALRAAVEHMAVDVSARNVLLTHQFVIGAARSESEELFVGGTEGVDATAFAPFDYVALGHLHRPQSCGTERIRYSGTPLKYSFSECGDKKSVTVAELGEKGTLSVRTVALTPLRDMVQLRGSYAELTRRSFYEGTSYGQDYVQLTLTDEEDIPDAVGKLRTIYHNLMKLTYDNARTRAGGDFTQDAETERKTPLELLGDFYLRQNNQPMSEEQTKLAKSLIRQIWEVEE